MSGVNKSIIIGNLVRDPEIRYLPDGRAVANISIATSESWKDKNTGEKTEKTEYHRVTAFAKQAEVMGEYLSKGSKVYIEGRLETRQWEKEGQKHYTTSIIVKEFQFLDSKGGQQSQPAQNSQQDDFSDDIPF